MFTKLVQRLKTQFNTGIQKMLPFLDGPKKPAFKQPVVSQSNAIVARKSYDIVIKKLSQGNHEKEDDSDINGDHLERKSVYNNDQQQINTEQTG